MAKEAYYFSHDYNARNDKKTAALVRDYKSSGYGIFWATCEMMHEEGGHLEFDILTIEAIATDLNEDPELITEVLEKCVSKYRLFTKQNEANEAKDSASVLQSSRVHRNLEGKNEKKAVKAEAGRLGGLKSGESRRKENSSKQNEAVLQPASSNEPNESKGNKIKETINNININGVSKSASWFDLKLELPEQTLHSAELNQFTLTQKNNTEFIKCQWKVFLSERLNDPPDKSTQHKKISDLTSYFLNWLRPKTPRLNGKTANGSVGKEPASDKF